MTMLRATKVIAAGDWKGQAVDTVVLDFDDRHRRRVTMQGVGGTSFLLDLLDTVALRTGDAVELEDGRLVEVVGAPENLSEIKAESPEHALRLAWHLGNRHLPVQIAGGKLRIRHDHVIEEMVKGLGGAVRAIQAPFDPEGGAYLQAAHKHEHHHHDGCCGHDHGHKHEHNHKHEHGASCGHDHSHDHGHKHEHKHGEGCCGHHHGDHSHKHG
jgi:urease accessory protein